MLLAFDTREAGWNQVGVDVVKFILASFGKIGKITQIFCSNNLNKILYHHNQLLFKD